MKNNDNNQNNQNFRTIKSFVTRERRLTNEQINIFKNSTFFLNHLNKKTDDIDNVDLDVLFDRKNNKRTLEIGFGNGDSLIQMAENEPERDFLGLEVHKPGIGNILLAIESKKLTNIRVINADAAFLIENNFFPKDSFDCVQIFFPDPWHKKRHNKRRLIQKKFLQDLYQIIKSDEKSEGKLHLATDWEPYSIHMLDVLNSCSGLFKNKYKDDEETEQNELSLYAPKPETRPTTKFEERGKRLGHKIRDIIFQKIPNQI